MSVLVVDREHLSEALAAYEIGEEIGRGATGVVFAATHRRLGRQVAVKALPPALAADPDVKWRFVEEAKLLASFNHVHIVPIYDFVEKEDLCLLIMERLTGGTLAGYRKAERPSGETASALALAMCSALHYAHRNDVLHRDVKPENALFASDGTLKVADFGIAKVLSGAATLVTRTGFVLGTPAYMAPEQARGDELTPATDVYATAVVLYWMLSGRLPFSSEGNPLEVLYRHLHEEPMHLAAANPAVNGELASAIMRAIERDPSERYATAEEFGVAVAHAANDAWGAGWLTRAETTLGAAGPIAEAVHGARGRVIAPTVASAHDDVDVDPADLVPVSALGNGRAAAPGDGVSHEPATAPAAPAAAGSRRRWAFAGVGGILVVAATAAVLLVAGRGGESSPPAPSATGPPVRTTSAWRVLRPAPTARQQFGATLFNGQVWSLGGLGASTNLPVATRAVQAYDPTVNSWQAGPPLPAALHHGMAVSYRGQLAMIGGWSPRGSDLSAQTSNKVYVLRGGKWLQAESLRHPRAAGAAVVVGNRLVVVGGQADGRLVRQTEVYDGKRWRDAAPIPTPREHLAAATDGRYVYVVGGRALSADKNSGALERYDPVSDEWERLPTMPTPRGGLGAAVVGGNLIALGGEDPVRVLGTAEAYNIRSRRWSRLPAMRTPRHGMAVVGIGRTVYALEGAGEPGHANSSAQAEALELES